MRVDRTRLKKGSSEVSPECRTLIDKIRNCEKSELCKVLSEIETWTYGKCELYHWIDVLDIFDEFLDEASDFTEGNDWMLYCDTVFKPNELQILKHILGFTTLLIEHSFSRHLYNSIEHLTTLLQSVNMEIVLSVLNLLYMFSKRSNFISRLNTTKRTTLLNRLSFIAESWGGKEYGFGLADCCLEGVEIPSAISSFYYEYYNEMGHMKSLKLKDCPEQQGQDPREVADYLCRRLYRVNEDLNQDQRVSFLSCFFVCWLKFNFFFFTESYFYKSTACIVVQ